MSLINDALKDLDRRGSLHEVDAVVFKACDEPVSKKRPLLTVAVLVFSTFFIYDIWQEYIQEDSFPAVTPVAEEIPPIPVEEENVPDKTVVSEVEKPVLDVVRKSEKVGIEKREVDVDIYSYQEKKTQDISHFLSMAERLFLQDRLTRPESESALHYYRKVLDKDAGNVAALVGLEKLQARYSSLVMDAIDKQQYDKARSMFSRAARLQINLNIDQNYEQQLAGASRNNVAQPAAVNENESRIQITLTQEEEQKMLLSNVEKSLIIGDVSNAENLLSDYLNRYPENSLIRYKLFDLYLNQGDRQQAEAQLHSVASDIPLFSLMASQLKLYEGMEGQALIVLGDATPDTELAETFYSYKAALLQKQEQWQSAADLYQLLIQRNVENSSYWLGLAVCADQLQRFNASLKAFQTVLRLGGQSPSVNQYVKARVQVLSQQVSLTSSNYTDEYASQEAGSW